jgi:hypothetical protein
MELRERKVQWEEAYVSEYLAKFWPRHRYIIHFKITNPPEPLIADPNDPNEMNLLRSYCRYADAIIFASPILYIVEAKLRSNEYLKALGEMLYYLEYIRENNSINWKEFSTIKGIIVIPHNDYKFMKLAEKYNIQVVKYKPTFWDTFIKYWPYRHVNPKRT